VSGDEGQPAPTEALPVSDTAGEPYFQDGHWRQDIKTDLGFWISAVVD
jgi:hypothetical protein